MAHRTKDHAAFPHVADPLVPDLPEALNNDTDARVAPDSVRNNLAAGRALRTRVPISTLGTLTVRPDRDTLAIISEQNQTRLPELLPLRKERMSKSAFTFYRGTAALMAADLDVNPHTNLLVPSCGDAHLSNFGFYASPQRTLVFDLNDFDEAAWAPWEWDLKRLITSIIVAGQTSSRDPHVVREAVFATVTQYASALRASVQVSALQRFYSRIEPEATLKYLPDVTKKALKKAMKQAKKRTAERAVSKLTTKNEAGKLSFVLNPPTMTPVDDQVLHSHHALLQRYEESASPDIQLLLLHYTFADAARRVVGVGSVGTRCTLHLFQDADGNALILQAKESRQSVLEQYGNISQPRRLHQIVSQQGEGARVVGMQRILQAVSDPFLGYLQSEGRDFYVRQFHDMKGGVDAETLDDESFGVYAVACGITLARAHSQSVRAPLVSGYVGGGKHLAEALYDWGFAYARLAEADFEQYVRAGS